MSEFTSLLQSRRSSNKFIKDVEIPNADLDEMFNLVKYGPSAFNLQHTHYVVVKDPEILHKVYLAANKQYKVQTASAIIMVLGNKNAYKDVGRMNEGLLQLGVINKQEFDMTVESVDTFYESRGETFKRDEAIRNASLSAMMFMLVAKEKGWDTCPMIGFDPDAIRTALNIPEQYELALMIAIGKEESNSNRPRGYRKPVGEFVSYNQF